MLDEWRDELENFYETGGTKKVIEQLDNNTAVMVTGNSGVGKTFIMKYVSLLFEKNGYEVVLISSPNDIILQRFPKRKQLFIIDDIIGKYRVDSVAVELWRRLHDRLKVVFKENNVKLLSTLRRQVYTDMSLQVFSTVFNSTVVDLESEDLVLSSNEKRGMLTNYMKRRKISENYDDNELLKICSCQFAFLLLCNLFTTNQEFLKMRLKFFESPSIVFIEELNRLQIENKEVYCVLVLVVMIYLEDLQTIFDINCEIERKEAFTKILRACEVPENIARRTLKLHLQSVAGMFVEKTNIFKFQHDRLEETIACHFGSQFPDILLQFCKLCFIRDRVRFSIKPTDDENILILKQSSFDVFSKRVIDEIIKGRFRDILLSEPMQCKKFIEHFAFYIEKHEIHLKDIENASCNETFLPPQQHEENKHRVLSVSNRFALLEELQSRKKLFIYWVAAMGCIQLFSLLYQRQGKDQHQNLKTDLLHVAVSGENIDVVKLLIDEGVNLKSYDEFGIPLLCKIAGTNRCDIAELLIDKGADVNQPDEMCGWTPCFVASWFNEAEMITFLLSKGASIEHFDSQRRVPLAIAVKRNNTESVSVLLNNGAKLYNSSKVLNLTYDIEIDFSSVLEEALHNNNPIILKMLLDSQKGKNKTSMSIPRSYRHAGLVGKLAIIFLMEIKRYDLGNPLFSCFVEICNAIFFYDMVKLKNIFAKEDSIEIFATRRGFSSIRHRRKMLATFNDNYLQFCPLHFSAICDNTTAANILIENGADPFQRDVLERTPLHFAKSQGMLKIFLSTNKDSEYSITYSPLNLLKMALKFCVTFEIVPFLFEKFSRPYSDLKANVRDINGNTPLHALILGMNSSECVDAVETLINNGADINIRCNKGYLPIDLFNTVSLPFHESVIDRGKFLLGGQKNKSYVKKEKWYFGILATLFVALYILFTFHIAKLACYRKETSSSSDQLLFYFQGMEYLQIVYMYTLHRLCNSFIISQQNSSYFGVDTKPIRSKLYSEQNFLVFLDKVVVMFAFVRFIALRIANVNSADSFFFVYCVLECIYFCILFIPNPCKNLVLDYHCRLIFVFKISLLSCFVLFLIFIRSSDTLTCPHNIVEENISWAKLLFFFITKGIMLYIYLRLFTFRLIKPLLCLVFQPSHLYKESASHLSFVLQLLFVIVEVLLVPLTHLFCEFKNC